MKKYLIIILSIITIHTHAMETEKSTNAIIPINVTHCHIDILDHIAQFLPFHDYEFEKEFVDRTQVLTMRQLPKECFIYFSKKYSAYSPNNVIVAASEKECFPKHDLVQSSEPSSPQICIINRKTNEKKYYKNVIGNFYQKLAVSDDGSMIATIYANYDRDPLTGETTKQLNLVVTYLNPDPNNPCDSGSRYDIPSSFEICDEHPTIAFNKQGTNIIVHSENSQHIIFQLRLNGPIDNRPQPNTDFIKTFAKYCAQRGICKNLITHIAIAQ
jgi:hypothetical protein